MVIIIQSDSIMSLPLPLFNCNDCFSKAGELHIALKLSCKDPQNASALLESVLLWLWQAVAEPILDEIGFKGSQLNGAALPRLWWITTGWVSMFPIHAMGDHKRALETDDPLWYSARPNNFILYPNTQSVGTCKKMCCYFPLRQPKWGSNDSVACANARNAGEEKVIACSRGSWVCPRNSQAKLSGLKVELSREY